MSSNKTSAVSTSAGGASSTSAGGTAAGAGGHSASHYNMSTKAPRNVTVQDCSVGFHFFFQQVAAAAVEDDELWAAAGKAIADSREECEDNGSAEPLWTAEVALIINHALESCDKTAFNNVRAVHQFPPATNKTKEVVDVVYAKLTTDGRVATPLVTIEGKLDGTTCTGQVMYYEAQMFQNHRGQKFAFAVTMNRNRAELYGTCFGVNGMFQCFLSGAPLKSCGPVLARLAAGVKILLKNLEEPWMTNSVRAPCPTYDIHSRHPTAIGNNNWRSFYLDGKKTVGKYFYRRPANMPLPTVHKGTFHSIPSEPNLQIIQLAWDDGGQLSSLTKHLEVLSGQDLAEGVSVLLMPSIGLPAKSTISTIEQYLCIVQQVWRLHDRDLVHGDIRLPNIIPIDETTAALIDFDYAGEEGQARYPTNLNPEIPRISGAEAGGLISKVHDVWSLVHVIGAHVFKKKIKHIKSVETIDQLISALTDDAAAV